MEKGLNFSSKMGDQREEIEGVFREATSTNLDDYFTRDRAAIVFTCQFVYHQIKNQSK